MTREDFTELLTFWKISLRNRRLSEDTIRSYMIGCRLFAEWCDERGTDPDLTVRNAEAFISGMLDGGKSPSTATLRQVAIRQFSAWLAASDPPEIDRDQLAGLRPPKLDQRVVDGLSTDEIRRLLGACQGKRLVDRRDTAIVRFLAATGARADELLSMRVYDLQIGAGSAVIVKGKGGKGRRVGFGTVTAESLARYSRMRARHKLAGTDVFWLADYGRVLTYEALYATLKRRARAAGIPGFHPHQLRHSMAVEWLAAGGSESGLLAQGGWSNISMIQRYTRAAAGDLAIAEQHRIGIDDI